MHFCGPMNSAYRLFLENNPLKVRGLMQKECHKCHVYIEHEMRTVAAHMHHLF